MPVLLLLCTCVVDAAQNRSEEETASAGVVLKEGTDALLECNVTGVRGDVRWYGPGGRQLVEEPGRRK